MRMVVSYGELVASIVNRGLIDEEFFLEDSGEQWMAWERMKPVVGPPQEPASTRKSGRTREAPGSMEGKTRPGTPEATRQMMARQPQPGPRVKTAT